MNAEEMIEAIRQGAEKVERSMGCDTERDLVRALVASFKRCDGDGGPCGEIATWSHGTCDRHRGRADGLSAAPLPQAPALRALCERMRTWGAPAAPVAASDAAPSDLTPVSTPATTSPQENHR